MSLTLKLSLILAAIIVLAIDSSSVSETHNLVAATCTTKVAYDKSGDMYCPDTSVQTVKVARK